MYGFGQRDQHTIPSELVRLAAADGVALEAHNFGTPAYVNWQGVELFARLLTEREAPDLVVFYDGYNDLSMQFVDGPLHGPSHVLAAVQQDRVEAPAATDQPTAFADVRDWWADHSGTVNLYRRIRDRLDGDEPEVRLTEAEASAVPADVDADAVEAATADLLGRGRDVRRRPGRGPRHRGPVLVPAHPLLQGPGRGGGAAPRSGRQPDPGLGADHRRASGPASRPRWSTWPTPSTVTPTPCSGTRSTPTRPAPASSPKPPGPNCGPPIEARDALNRPVRDPGPRGCLWPVGGALTNLRSRCRTSSAATSRWPYSARPP